MNNEWLEFYRGKRVLVTGGTGSIGSKLVEQLLENGAEVCVLSRGENKQVELYRKMEWKFNRYPKLEMRIGDVRNRQTLIEAAYGVSVIFHVAAMKHVDICEKDPWEAVQTNVLGAQNLWEACWDRNVEAVVLVSTDKAADPAGVMGETKHLAERLFLAREMGCTRVVVTRFGNVLGSSGSVIWKFKEMIERGEVLTVTDPAMLRFVMTPQQATELVLWAGANVTKFDKCIVTRSMVSTSVGDLVKVLSAMLTGGDYQTEVIGSRPGEKYDETLFSDAERPQIIVFDAEIGKVASVDKRIRPHPMDNMPDFDIYRQRTSPERLREMLVEAGVLQ